MERATRLSILAATLVLCAWSTAPTLALASDDDRAQVITVIVSDDATPAPEALAQTPPPSRPPRSARSAQSPQAPEAPPAPGAPEVPYPAPAAAPAPPAEPDLPSPPARITPRGWFGFALECAKCTAERSPRDTAAVWRFNTQPYVYSVQPGTPAARAGFRRGDVITGLDDISILTPDGGRRFGLIQPGQVVRWTVIRDGEERRVVAQAAERPDRPSRVAIIDLQRQLRVLGELGDADEMRRELIEFDRRLERLRVREETRIQTDRQRPVVKRFRYAGVIGGSEVEVRGPDAVIVNSDGAEMVINVGETVVKIRVPDPPRKRAAPDSLKRRERKATTPK